MLDGGDDSSRIFINENSQLGVRGGSTAPSGVTTADPLQNFFSSLWYKQTKSDRPANEAPKLVAPVRGSESSIGSLPASGLKRRHASDSSRPSCPDVPLSKQPHLSRIISKDKSQDVASTAITQRNAMLSQLLNKQVDSPSVHDSSASARAHNKVSSSTDHASSENASMGMSNDPLLSNILQEASDMQNEWINRNNG